ncbi:ATP-binding protein [Streptomyces sp. MMBL 11-1]|uniref:ATP-binding protein n=1 Tax=Streptomyces sp. MMBL 11-1 TaxID=3026420 RepID=UPI0023609176|nr:ATP-binding protein [Streptomyces sp. MMBL 11-1]
MVTKQSALPVSEPGLYLRSRERGFVAHMVAGPLRLRQVRSLTATALLDHGASSDAAGTAQLVLSELVANAVRACGDDVPLVVEVHLGDTGAVVGVHDPVPELLPHSADTPMGSADAESGRGLPLLNLLCTDVTVTASPIGKQIRCRLRPS